MEQQLSKSEKKRRAKGIELLVKELALLPENEINLLPCEEDIRAELRSAKKLKGSTRKRQLKYVTKILRKSPVDGLYSFMEQRKGSQLKKSREFHQLENLRDSLISEAVERYEEIASTTRYVDDFEDVDFLDDYEALDMVVGQLPGVDRELIRNTAFQFARTRNRKFSRELFRILKAAFEKLQYSQSQGDNNGI